MIRIKRALEEYSNIVYPYAKEVTTQDRLALTPEIDDLSDRQT